MDQGYSEGKDFHRVTTPEHRNQDERGLLVPTLQLWNGNVMVSSGQAWEPDPLFK